MRIVLNLKVDNLLYRNLIGALIRHAKISTIANNKYPKYILSLSLSTEKLTNFEKSNNECIWSF